MTLEQRLDAFLQDNNITSDQMHESVARMQQVDPDHPLMCMEYLVAAIDYTEFQYFMLDFKVSPISNVVGCELMGGGSVRRAIS